MSIRDAYTRWSATYDSQDNPTRDLDARVTRQRLAGRRYRHILELGCGTGKNTVFLAEIGDQVQALDFSEGMLALAHRKVTAANVTFARADLTRPWPCPDASFDLIVCNLVLEHIEDLAFIFAEAARCLSLGGRFFVCELHPFRQYDGTKAIIEHAGGVTEIPAYLHHVSEFLDAASGAGLTLIHFGEWWRHTGRDKPPQLLSLELQKPNSFQ